MVIVLFPGLYSQHSLDRSHSLHHKPSHHGRQLQHSSSSIIKSNANANGSVSAGVTPAHVALAAADPSLVKSMEILDPGVKELLSTCAR